MTWKRLALAALLSAVTVLASFFSVQTIQTEWYARIEPHGDGQVGMSIFFGSAFVALICGAVMFVAVAFGGRERP